MRRAMPAMIPPGGSDVTTASWRTAISRYWFQFLVVRLTNGDWLCTNYGLDIAVQGPLDRVMNFLESFAPAVNDPAVDTAHAQELRDMIWRYGYTASEAKARIADRALPARKKPAPPTIDLDIDDIIGSL